MVRVGIGRHVLRSSRQRGVGAHLRDLHKLWWLRRGGSGRGHGGVVLRAGGGVDVNGNAAGNDDGRVVAVVEIARDAKDNGNGGEKNEKREPATFKAEGAAGE